MFPSTFFGLFPAFPKNNKVFVAMPFSDRFSLRWEHVIKPGISAAGLEPHRVDLSKVADSIPLKILQEIGQSRLVFADITTENGLRNANVMYELGLAQAVRRPEEVIVFRSDNDTLPFDIAPIFAESYRPDGGPGATAEAIAQITRAVARAIESINLTRHVIVQRIVDSLDVPTFEVLAIRTRAPFLPPLDELDVGDAVNDPRVMSGVSRLLSAGVLQTQLPDVIQMLEKGDGKAIAARLRFTLTPLGRAVVDEFVSRFYAGRTPDEAFAEFVRVQAAQLASRGTITTEVAEQLMRDAKTGAQSAIAQLRTLLDADGAR